jgi:hypothetical protein
MCRTSHLPDRINKQTNTKHRDRLRKHDIKRTIFVTGGIDQDIYWTNACKSAQFVLQGKDLSVFLATIRRKYIIP